MFAILCIEPVPREPFNFVTIRAIRESRVAAFSYTKNMAYEELSRRRRYAAQDRARYEGRVIEKSDGYVIASGSRDEVRYLVDEITDANCDLDIYCTTHKRATSQR